MDRYKQVSMTLRAIGIIGCGLILFATQSAAALTWDDVTHVINQHAYYDPNSIANNCVVNINASTVDRFLQVLAAQESGNPTAENGASSASGKYQYIDKSWKSHAEQYYPPALQYPRAKDAPEEVQDALAYIEYSSKFRDLGSDPYNLALSHFYPKALTDPSVLDIIPSGNKLTPRQYAEQVTQKMADGVGLDIPLLYRQAPDFETHFAAIGTAPSGAGSSEQASAACQQGVPSDEFVFYNQYDGKWADHAYGSSTVAESGCGPTSVAMVVATLKDKTVTPVEAADFGTANGAYIEGRGSDWIKMLKDGPEHWGLRVTSLDRDINAAIDILNAGGLVLASGQGPTPFTTNGHIIVLRGTTLDGKILVGDPAHPEANTTAYDSNELLKSITSLWGVTL